MADNDIRETANHWCPHTVNKHPDGSYAECVLPLGHDGDHQLQRASLTHAATTFTDETTPGEGGTQLLGEVGFISGRTQVRVVVRFPSGSEVTFEQDEPTHEAIVAAHELANMWAQRFWR